MNEHIPYFRYFFSNSTTLVSNYLYLESEYPDQLNDVLLGISWPVQ